MNDSSPSFPRTAVSQKLWTPLRAVERRPAIAVVVLAVILFVLLLQTCRQANRPQGYDLTSYLLSARALWNNENPYQTDTRYPYLYPPFFAFVMIPLAALPNGLVDLLWFALNVAGLVAGCLALVRLAPDELHTTVGWHLAWPGLALFLVLILPIQSNLLNGQVNLIVLFCCIMFFNDFQQHRDFRASLWLSAAIAIKLLPVVLLLFVVVRRRWRVVGWTLLATALFSLLPWLAVGRRLLPLYEHYARAFLIPSFTDPGPQKPQMFFGLRGTILYFLPGAALSVWPKLLSLLAALGILLAVDVAARASKRPQNDVWAFCAYLLCSLLASPAAEMHHLTLAAPAVVLVGMKCWFDRRWATPTVWIVVVAFVTCFCILGKWCNMTPTFFAALMLLALLLLRAVRSPQSAASESFYLQETYTSEPV